MIAVEKGTNQMKAPLRYDAKVELFEKTDIFDFEPGEVPNVVVADVSFVSLKKVLARLSKIFNRHITPVKIDYLVMLKPQFEAKAEQLNKGVVKNEKMRREILRDFETWLKQNGFLTVKKRDNTLAGKHGNIERFYWLRRV